jgi:hypothetical protein
MKKAAGRFMALAVVLITLLGLSACANGGEDSDADIEVGDAGDLPGTVENEAQVVSIELYDDHIQMPATIDSNIRSFRLLNDGDEDHTIAIRGDNVDLQFNEQLGGGNEKIYTIDAGLAPGTYQFYCPNEGHADRGETVDVTVQD